MKALLILYNEDVRQECLIRFSMECLNARASLCMKNAFPNFIWQIRN